MSNSKYKLKGLSLNLKKLPLPLLVDMTAVSVSPELHRAQVTILNILSVASNDIERGRDELRQLKDALGGGDDIPSIKMLEEYINDYKITDDMVRKAKELCDTSHDTDNITDSTNEMKGGVVVINDLQGSSCSKDFINEACDNHHDSKRKCISRWNDEMVECLVKGVNKYGVGKWRQILSEHSHVFPPKTDNVTLKDKWRNLTKYDRVINIKGTFKLKHS